MPPKTRSRTRAEESTKGQEEDKTRNDIDSVEIDENDSKNDEKNLGSGLAAFFGDFFPNNESSLNFSTGLSELPTSDPLDHTTHIKDKIGVTYTPGGLSYNEWRRKEKESLTEYLMLRLHPHASDEENVEEDGSSSESSLDDTDVAVDAPETQLGMETQEPLGISEKPLASKAKRKPGSIPYIQDCLHDLTRLEFLDLHAKTLTLGLSRIDKMWKLRNTKRFASSIRKPVFENTSKRRRKLPQNLVFEEREEDGPTATIYKKVMHLELEELQTGSILPSSSKKGQTRRIKVFFYNSYATAIKGWLKEQERQIHKSTKRTKKGENTLIETTMVPTDIVMSLSNVPAACIFPYVLDPRNWRQQKYLVDYCLCIGDRSVATLKNQSEQYANSEHQIRFDSTNLEIRMMAVVSKTTTTKTTTDTGTTVTTETTDEVDTSSELILSKRVLAKDFLSSSGEDNTPNMDASKPSEESNISPLKANWEAYQKNEYTSDSNQQPSSERPPLRQLNQSQEQPEGESSTNEKQSKGGFVIEPMMFEGLTPRQSDSKELNYVKLGEITKMVEESRNSGKGCNFKVNVYASVVAVTPPRITKRGDWMIAATLLDESCTTPMTLNIFCKKQEHLPNLIWMGDVIRIHRAAIDKWYNKIQLQGLKPTQYVVIRKIGGNWKVIPTATNTFTFNRSDEVRSQKLWRWANSHSEKHPTMKAEHCFTVDEMQRLKSDEDERTFEHKDITVMVVQKLRYQYADVLPHGLLRVWDGTGNPPSDPLFMPGKIQHPTSEEQPSAAFPKAIEAVIGASQQLQASHASMETPISLCGRLSNVVIWEKSHWALIQKHIPVGTFLRLRNVHIPQRWEGNNFRSIFMHDRSWMTALPTNNYEVCLLLLQHSERLRRGTSYNREFGGVSLSSCRFVGSGLKDFCMLTSKANVYTGAVHLYATDSNHPTASRSTAAIAVAAMVKVADRSGSVSALVSAKTYRLLQTLQPNDSIQRRFLVKIRKIVVGGSEQHLVLTNLAPMDP